MKLHELTEVISEDGKSCKLTDVQKRLLAKIDRELRPANGPRQNPFSGAVVQLNDAAASIYDWLTWWYREYSRLEAPPKGFPIQTYDRVKYLFLEFWPQAYMDLID